MKGWVTAYSDGAVKVARQNRQRLDVSAETKLPGAGLSLGRIAHQIRQDVWRACQNVRGFSPVVSITPENGSYKVLAGGQLDQKRPANLHLVSQIDAVLSDPDNRNRWITHAKKRIR